MKHRLPLALASLIFVLIIVSPIAQNFLILSLIYYLYDHSCTILICMNDGFCKDRNNCLLI